jgi:aspartyl-tRNA synthetase
VVDFPLLEWDEDANRFFAMHHPFTSPKAEDFHLLETDPGNVRANAYDMVILTSWHITLSAHLVVIR